MEDVAARQVRERAVSPDAGRPPPVEELTRDTASEARWAAAVAILSRIALVVVALVTTLTLGVRTRAIALRDPAHAEVLSGALRHLFEPWAHWDGVWYIRIAADGYRAHEFSPAFFPLYPLVMRFVSPLTGHNYVIAGVVVSLTCYACAMAVLYSLARDEFGRGTALWSVVLISVFPTALVFQAVYSESLFLLLAVSCFAAARRGHWWLAGLAGLLATLTRSSGLLLLLPLAVMWWEQRTSMVVRLPGGPAGGTPASGRRPSLPSLAWLLLVPAGLALYMAYLWQTFHHALLFGVVQGNWGRRFSLPSSAIWRGGESFLHSLHWLTTHGLGDLLALRTASGGFPVQTVGNVVEFLGLLVAVALLVICWRRLPAAYTVYALAALLFPLFYPSVGRPLSSLPRFVLVDFPLFIGLAAILCQHRVLRWVVVAGLLVPLVVSTVYFTSWA